MHNSDFFERWVTRLGDRRSIVEMQAVHEEQSPPPFVLLGLLEAIEPEIEAALRTADGSTPYALVGHCRLAAEHIASTLQYDCDYPLLIDLQNFGFRLAELTDDFIFRGGSPAALDGLVHHLRAFRCFFVVSQAGSEQTITYSMIRCPERFGTQLGRCIDEALQRPGASTTILLPRTGPSLDRLRSKLEQVLGGLPARYSPGAFVQLGHLTDPRRVNLSVASMGLLHEPIPELSACA